MESEIGVIVATHGRFSESIVETVEMILARETKLRAFTFPEGETAKTSLKKLQSLIKKCNKGNGVFILVDLFGGTPGSLALSMLEDETIEVITGINLPMALAAATLDPGMGIAEATEALVRAGKDGIKGAGSILRA